MAKVIKSTLVKLPPHKRKVLLGKPTTKILLGRNMHGAPRPFEVTDIQFEDNRRLLKELCDRGEIEIYEDGRPYVWPARRPRPVGMEARPAPADAPEPAAKPLPEPDVVVTVDKPKPAPKPAPKAEPAPKPKPATEENGYSLDDLKAMKKDDLMDLASRMGIEDKIHYKDKKAKLVSIIWKNMD
jgi:hypothetical protein